MEQKKFEVRKDATKKFEIRPDSRPEWFRQRNESDCGPCLILNGLRNIEGARHIPQSIHEVRQEVNRVRREDGRDQLQPDGWLSSEDIQGYLRNVAGLDVKEYACFADSIEEVSRTIHAELKRPFSMLYSTTGRHFRGIVRRKTT